MPFKYELSQMLYQINDPTGHSKLEYINKKNK